MHIEELRKAILEELKQCADKDLLLDVLLKFYPYPGSEEDQKIEKAAESGASYAVNINYQIPEWKWEQLKEDSEKCKRGALELSDWEDVEARLKAEYDL